MNLSERADISRRYLLQKGETVSAQTVEDLMLELNAAKETISNLEREGVKQTAALPAMIEGWLMYSDGVIERDSTSVGMIYGVHYGSIDQILNELVRDFNAFFDGQLPEDYDFDGNGCIEFEITNISYNEGQMSFPETGQWDFAPHYEFDAKIKKHEKWNDEGVYLVEL